MESVMIIATTIIALLGVVCYVALAGIAVVYSLGANKSPKGRRIFFGILGVVMIYVFVYMCIYLHK